MTAEPIDPVEPAGAAPRRKGALRRAFQSWGTRIGAAITLLVVGIAVIGPLVAPHSASDLVAFPLSGPAPGTPLGTDYLGHDVLSSVLHGGWTVVWMATAATAIGMVVGTLIGLIAGYAKGRVDSVLMWLMDLVLAFPQFVLPLMVISMLQPSLWLIVLLVALSHAPRVARLARATTTQVSTREYIEASEVLGEPRWRILLQEILPNISTPLLVEVGVRMAWSIGLIASISFLGLGVQPPDVDWGLMIQQNRGGLATQPWAVVVPVLLIALFAIGINLMSEGYSRAIARRNDSGVAA
ncbi:ABC transporter permease subunit [Gordonia sp. SID5947]|nr:ABC transporter permease subunit [Gordonia sp. SID5947]